MAGWSRTTIEIMWVCAIETSSRHGEAALLGPEGSCRSLPFTAELSHAKGLFPSLQDLCASCGCVPGSIDLLVVDYGPGSYTGIRVGVAAAKVLAFALEKPVVPVNSLDVLVENVDNEAACCVAPILDAKLGQVYAAVFSLAPPQRILYNFVGSVEELVPKIPPGTVVFGDGVDRYSQELAAFPAGPEEWARPRAEIGARLGKQAFLSSGAVDTDALAPLYLRQSLAEQKLSERGSDAP